jgi:hypothetical protein
MLLHIRPKIVSRGEFVELIDLKIDPFGLRLRHGIELMTGHPYPNKNWTVACRKKGKKVMDGILLNLLGDVDRFSYTARWNVYGDSVTHRVFCSILDHDFSAASDSAWLWHATFDGAWSDRWPRTIEHDGTMYIEPSMELESRIPKKLPTNDVVDIDTGWVSERTQYFSMPTIEEARLFLFPREDSSRMPSLDDAFGVVSPRRPPGRETKNSGPKRSTYEF